MALFEMTADALQAIPPTDFTAEGIWERRDLQRLLRDNIAAVDESLLVIAEEFGDFEGSDRRIDLLCIDRDARVVVVELKRTYHGGHMDLQALRYAAMVSSLTFDQVVDVFERHLARVSPDRQGQGRQTLTDWLDDTDELSGDVRIVLVSAGFGAEITTTVLWLTTTYALDITCIRLTPHRVDDRILLDITQLIPLSEAEEFTIRLRHREQAARTASSGRDWAQYVIATPPEESKPLRKRWAILELVQRLHSAGVPMTAIADVIPGSRIISAPGILDGPDLIEQFTQKYKSFGNNIHKWFTDHPIHDHDATWLVSNAWGRQTAPTLDRLVELAPNQDFSYRAAP
ncbi:hypothetical protein [Nocardia sp. NRRL S-836]|uniref:hypothetical protein n=1 Tax=Nocardia sp. NRRL S-836 TaxID=1519492 RepID=UPI0007C7645B|nr:hypothetical protein [Nocardia sp. NRRL S-836]